jgi:hypothetical protein
MNNQCNTCQPDTYGAGLLSYLPANGTHPSLSSDCPQCPSESGVQTFVPTNLSEWIGVKEVPP